jgi:hypothetical protein
MQTFCFGKDIYSLLSQYTGLKEKLLNNDVPWQLKVKIILKMIDKRNDLSCNV